MTEAYSDYESPYKSGGYSSAKEQRMSKHKQNSQKY